MKLIGFLSLFLSIQTSHSGISLKHEFHVSKTLLEYDSKNELIQVSMHIFIDDLELALENRGIEKLYLCTGKEKPESESHVFQYLSENLLINVNNSDVKPDWVGKETSEDLTAVWCYLEIKNVAEWKTLEVQNMLLNDIFDDQKNIVQIIGPNKKPGYFLFQKGDSAERIEF